MYGGIRSPGQLFRVRMRAETTKIEEDEAGAEQADQTIGRQYPDLPPVSIMHSGDGNHGGRAGTLRAVGFDLHLMLGRRRKP